MEVEGVAEEEAAGARKRKRLRAGAGEENGAIAEVKEMEDEDIEMEYFGGGVYEKELLLLLQKDEADADANDDGGGITEEAVAEVMRWLEAEISDDVSTQEAGFVTITGSNDESCGPSVSCAASTVMASVDTRAGAPPPPRVPWPWPYPENAVMKQEDAVDGSKAAVDDVEEAWLVELLLACKPAVEGIY